MNRVFVALLLIACVFTMWCLHPAFAQEAESGMLAVLPTIQYEGSSRALLTDLCHQANVRVFFDKEVPDRHVSCSGKNISLADVCTEVLVQSEYTAATDGSTIFVLSRKFDQISPESAVMQMPVLPSKAFDPASLSVLPAAQDAFVKQKFDRAKNLMAQALQATYEVDGKEGYVYEIVRRYADIYSKQNIQASEAVMDFDQDDFLSRLLLRFLKRKAVTDANFDYFMECITELDKPSLGSGLNRPSSAGFSTASAGSDCADPAATRQPPVGLPPGVGLNQALSALEDSVLGHRYERESVPKRLARMEQLMFPHDVQRRTLSIPERVNDLFAAADPSGSLMRSASRTSVGPADQKNWFLNPPPMAMFNNFGKGVAKIGSGIVRGPAEVGKNVLSSPLFWESVLLGGAAVGGYFILKNASKNGIGYSGPTQYGSGEHACVGGACNKCTNCNSCPYCKSAFLKCNVFYLVRGMRSP